MATSKPAPGDLALVQSFVNTLDLEDGSDALGDPDGLRAWLAEHELCGADERLGRVAVERAGAVREALRALLRANNGEELDPRAPAVLDEASRRAGLALRFRPDGGSVLEPTATGIDGALGRILTVASDAQADGVWHRLKACRAHGCEWAFYDATRNRSGVWCSMRVCGNREKVRAYRDRRGPS